MQRRTFIKITAALTAIAVAGFFMIPSFQKTVRRILILDTSNLKIDASLISQFMEEATEEQFWAKFSLSKKILIVLHTYSGFLNALIPYRNKYLLYRNQITGHFLLSTDFFLNKMNEDKEVRYVQFFNPYKQPCFNPFSTNFYPETV